MILTRLKRILSLIICTAFILSFLAGPVLAKGAKGGFSSGGRSSFSSGAKGHSSSGSSYSSTPKSAPSVSSVSGSSSSGTSGAGVSTGKAAPSGTAQSTVGGGTGSYGKGYSTDTESFSTPRQNSPPSLTSDYSTNKQGFSTGTGSYSTGTGSYSGSWNRDTLASSGVDKYPARPPVGVFGSPPQPAYQYHNNYWAMPFLARAFFQPNYYHTPWGYHFYAPRLLTWVIGIILIGAVVILIRNKMKGSA